MKIKAFKSQIALLYAEGSVSEVIGVLAEILREHSDGQWDEGNCRLSVNLCIAAEILEVVAENLDFNYNTISNEEWKDVVDNIIVGLEDIIL